MDSLPYPILTNLLEVISASSEYSDYGLVRKKTLNALFRAISAEGAILILPDRATCSTHVMIKNLDEKFHGYYKSYFHRFDPLQLLRGIHRGARLTCLEGACTYSYDAQKPSEYYTDFLKPQKIHHKLIANLVSGEEMYGRVVWMRSRKSDGFTDQEIRLARTISPYLAHALAYNELQERLKLKGEILNSIEKESSVGVILLDEKLQVIHVNQKAEELFAAVEGNAAGGSGREQMLSRLIKNCREIKAGMKGSPSNYKAIPRKRTISVPHHTGFAVTFKALDRSAGAENALLFMICIEELSPPSHVDAQFIMDSFHLSKREIEVADLLFSGLKNAQIANKLFISEITVKKHLQNIYHKVGVNNRTSLVNKMLTRTSHSPSPEIGFCNKVGDT
jgi:DNA-binding CsgD family transcriptional regulator/PAS domain-containing protein